MFGSHLILTKIMGYRITNFKILPPTIKPINPFASKTLCSLRSGVESLLVNKIYDSMRINKLVDELKSTLEFENKQIDPTI